MSLTELLKGHSYHELVHVDESFDQMEARRRRITQAFRDDVMKCLRECGCAVDMNVEYAITMSTLTCVDKVIELATSRERVS